jgi:hypothetical protein
MTLLRLAPAPFFWRWSTVEGLRRREEVPGSFCDRHRRVDHPSELVRYVE